MSDMMRPPGGMPPGGGMGGGMPQGMPPGGGRPAPGPQDVQSKLQGSMSMFNPTDAAMMKKQIDPKMTLRQFFESQGYNVDTTTLIQFAQDQAQKAQPVNKAKAMGGQPLSQSPGQPSMGMGSPSAAPVGGPQEPSLGGALKGMRNQM